jgi:hypothetical protein
MLDKDIIREQAIAEVQKTGCCLGKYRIPIGGIYYCYLLDVYKCKHQNRKFIKTINSEMAECKSNEQRLCEECDQYRTASAEAKEKLKVMIS